MVLMVMAVIIHLLLKKGDPQGSSRAMTMILRQYGENEDREVVCLVSALEFIIDKVSARVAMQEYLVADKSDIDSFQGAVIRPQSRLLGLMPHGRLNGKFVVIQSIHRTR